MPSSGVQTCALDRKSTRLNSSHGSISYAVFCLQKATVTGIQTRGLKSEEHTSSTHTPTQIVSPTGCGVVCGTSSSAAATVSLVQTCALRSEEHTSERQSR